MRNLHIPILFLCAIIAIVCAGSNNNVNKPLVEIPLLGKIEGDFQTSLEGRTFFSFQGVPYVRPPLGKYRFKEATPLKPWKGIWQAKTIYTCLQYYQYTPAGQDFVIGNEDCLYLNIYTPTLNQNANLDVIVYIHGGAFMFNNGAVQGPQYLLDKDVVYINLNYRLGPLGFLSTEDDVVPGNTGLKDQIAALRWIKENVKYFGGNPNSITISGMSAGGASVHAHFLTPKSQGLFHRGISQSGTMLNPWVLMEKPLEKTQKLAVSLGCPVSVIKEMIHCLRKRPGTQIVAAVKEFQAWMYNPFSPFGLVVDSAWSADPVFPDHPYTLLKSGQINDLPWILSHTNSEGLYPGMEFYSNEDDLKAIDTRWNELIPHILDYNYTIEDPKVRDEVSQKIRIQYLKENQVSRNTFKDLIKLLSDRIFLVDIWKSARLHLASTKSPIYFYYFTYRGSHSRSETRFGFQENFGAAHGDDTSYVFKTSMDVTTTENDRLMVKKSIEMWTSFAKTGKPNVGLEWPSLSKTATGLTALRIDGPQNITVENLVLDIGTFWDSLPIAENDKLFTAVKEEL